uniref:DNA topoisomerase IV n=1 Tax=Flavobacterium sp. TaxID=239 RepID=UPI00404AB242
MKLSKYLLIILPLIITSCYNQERNCTDFKTGKFTSEITLNEETITSTFERNDSIQIENFEGVVDTFTVRWINDCEYVIKNKKPKNMLEKKVVSIKILYTTDNSYTFEYNYVGDSNKQKGIATKL